MHHRKMIFLRFTATLETMPLGPFLVGEWPGVGLAVVATRRVVRPAQNGGRGKQSAYAGARRASIVMSGLRPARCRVPPTLHCGAPILAPGPNRQKKMKKKSGGPPGNFRQM